MNVDVQTAAVLLIVGAAAVYLVRVVWLVFARRKAAACSACGNCPSAASAEPRVVELGRGMVDAARNGQALESGSTAPGR
jgi:hypothetical protein